MSSLVPCFGCDRFVRATDAQCPFCGTTREVVLPRSARKHVARAAMLAVAMASAPGCGKSTEVEDARVGDAASDSGVIPSDADTRDADTRIDSGYDAGEIVAPPYGVPPPPPEDAGDGDDDASTSPDSGSSVDAGMDSGVIVAPPYGIPPDPDAGGPAPADADIDAELVAPAYGGFPAK